MKDFSAETIDFICWSFREGDFDRARRRALINQLFNGAPPYTEREVQENNITVNVNTLAGVRAAHDARAQFSSVFTKPGVYFQCRTDAGARHKRTGYGTTVTNHIGKCMKRSLPYFETMRSKFASTILHGIAPCVFEDSDCWATRPMGVEDVYVPSNTLLYDIASQKIPFFANYRSFKGPELIRMAKGPKVDPGWNVELVDACLKWIDEQTLSMAGDQWTDYLSPEKWEERIKSDGTFYSGDRAPTVNAWDFYFWDDSKNTQGWKRKMILDPWTMPSATGIRTRRNGDPFTRKNQFLYNPGDRKYASKLSEIINWQFADLSAVSPFGYHSVRSLGWLLYSVCHLQNRTYCKFSEAVFEQLMVLMRIKSQDDMQRALSVNLVNRGFIDESVDFIKAGDRYQVNAQLALAALGENNNLISRNSSSFTAKPPSGGVGGEMKVPTATQWLGEESKVTQLVSAGLAMAYEYQRTEFQEIFRRFTKKHSTDPEVQMVQAKCLKDGVPEKVLYNIASWDIEPERLMGGGNKTIEMAVAQQLMAYRNLYDPQAQRRILKKVTLAITDDAAEADALVPDVPVVSSSVHDAQLAVGTLLIGQPMELRENVSHVEYAQALIDALGVEIAKSQATGGVTDQSHIMGMMNLAGQSIDGQPIPGNGAANHIAIVAQDEQQKDIAKVLGDQLGKLMNEVKAFEQRLQEQQQAAAQQNGGLDAETQAKIVSMEALTDSKMQSNAKSNAQRTAVRQVQDEMKMEREQQKFQMEMSQSQQEHAQEMALQAQKDALEVTKAAALAKIEVSKQGQKSQSLTGKGEKG